ncbi:MAG: phospholipase D-like domain-containing protein [Candidatus Woesearchaeota archaeon]
MFKLIVALAVLIIVGAGLYLGIDLEGITGDVILGKTESVVKDRGDTSVFFCPQDNCSAKLVNFLDSAEQSIDCAVYDLGLEEVKKKLLEKEEKIGVRMVMDNDYLKKFNHSFVKADSWGLMHNKFCIVDGKAVFTGSFNPTENGAYKNNNNILIINSKVIAENYQDEFEEMWSGVFKKGEPIANPSVELSGVSIETYFCPEDSCAEHVKEELSKATESISFMTFSFTHEGIANILLVKNYEGIEIKGVMEARQISEYSKFVVLNYQGIDVLKDGNPNNMHHKVFIVDNQTVITGSFNPTKGGDERNDENLIIIHDKDIAEQYLQEFEKVYQEAKD